jgi:hypothetical protein
LQEIKLQSYGGIIMMLLCKSLCLLILLNVFQWSRQAGKMAADTPNTNLRNSALSPVADTPDCRYGSFLQLFKKVEPPYFFMTDSIKKHGYPWKKASMVDTTGEYICNFITPELLRNCLADTTYAGPHCDMISRIAENPEWFGNGSGYWYTFDAFIRLDLPEKDILFILSNYRYSATNGGYVDMLACTFSKTGKLLNITWVESSGGHCSKRMHEPGFEDEVEPGPHDTIGWWKQTTDMWDLNVNILSAEKLQVERRDWTEIVLSEWYAGENPGHSFSRDTSYVINRKTEHSEICLE